MSARSAAKEDVLEEHPLVKFEAERGKRSVTCGQGSVTQAAELPLRKVASLDGDWRRGATAVCTAQGT